MQNNLILALVFAFAVYLTATALGAVFHTDPFTVIAWFASALGGGGKP